MAGTIDGINEHGLAITFNYAFVKDTPQSAVPISMAITAALAGCRTAKEASEQIAARPRWGAGILMLADATGDLLSLELSNTRHAIRRPLNGDDALFHTNLFRTPEMREVEVSPEAIFGQNAPTAIRGLRVLESAEVRWNRFEQLLEADQKFGPDELADLMSDHGAAAPTIVRSACTAITGIPLRACSSFRSSERCAFVFLRLRRRVHRLHAVEVALHKTAMLSPRLYRRRMDLDETLAELIHATIDRRRFR